MNSENNNTYYLSLHKLDEFDKEHPYILSSIISIIIVTFFMFYASPFELTEEDFAPQDMIEFIDIDSIESRAVKRSVKKDYSTEEGDVSTSNVERATGTSDDPNAVDLAFHPNIARPKPIGGIKKRYPKIAREKNVEAMVSVEILIASTGRVKNVHILRIKLLKEFPPDLHSKIAKAFARDAIKTLTSVRFTSPIVNGKKTAIKMEMNLRFRMEN